VKGPHFTMAIFEEKFIVINLKHIKQLSQSHPNFVEQLKNDLEFVSLMIPPNNYYVCNQDEPYAQTILEIILEGETKKETDGKHQVR
jgi:hypothetical protein